MSTTTITSEMSQLTTGVSNIQDKGRHFAKLSMFCDRLLGTRYLLWLLGIILSYVVLQPFPLPCLSVGLFCLVIVVVDKISRQSLHRLVAQVFCLSGNIMYTKLTRNFFFDIHWNLATLCPS